MMRKMRYLLVIGALLIGVGVSSFGATSKEKLISSLYKQQRQTERTIIKMWFNHERGKELEKVLSDYVSREVRLQAMTGRANNHTLLSKVTRGDREVKNPVELAREIVIEHMREQGIDLRNCTFVKGDYMIRKSCLDPHISYQ